MNDFRSIECQIMDWADDTAYSINDIIDGVRAGYLTAAKIERWAEENPLGHEDSTCLETLLDVIGGSRFENFLNKEIGRFIHGVRLVERCNPLSEVTHRYRFGLQVAPDTLMRTRLYKAIAVDLIFRSPQIHRIEYKGGMLLEKLFHSLVANYTKSEDGKPLNLVSRRFSSQLQTADSPNEQMRILCDSIAEMTDALAIRTYKQLFDPDFASILDIV